MQDILRPYVPEYMGQVEEDNECILSKNIIRIKIKQTDGKGIFES